MTDPHPGPDFDDVERRLLDRQRAAPPPALRGRVLTAVRGELRRRRRSAWGVAGAVAAAALLWVNLSGSVANNTTWTLSEGCDPDRLAVTAGRLREVAPELSEREVLRLALLIQGASRRGAAPALPGSPDTRFTNRGNSTWDSH